MENIVPGSFKLMKKINTGLIIDTIRSKGPISRADIAKQLNLTPATITNITAELINKNIIVESELGESTGGRKPILLKINTSSYFILSIYIGSSGFKAAVLDMESKILDSVSFKLKCDMKFDLCWEHIKESILRLIKNSSINNKKIIGIGVAVDGLVDFNDGKIIYAPALGWENIELRYMLEKEFDVPVYVDRDARAMAFSESWYGEGKEVDTFICISVGFGIGAALTYNKQQIRGAAGGFGEFGHFKISENGPLCSCGKHGCLQSYASESFVIDYAVKNGFNGRHEIDNIIREALIGNTAAIAALETSGKYLGIGIANLINMFNPSLILVGGDLIDTNDIYFNAMMDSAKNNAIEHLYNCVKIKKTFTGRDAIIQGLAVLVLDNLFDDFSKDVLD